MLISTDTVMALAVAGSLPHALTSLRSARARMGGRTDEAPSSWHAPDVVSVLDALGDCTPLLRRAISRLWPGPVTFQIELNAQEAQRITSRTGLLPGAAADAAGLLVRVSTHPALHVLASSAELPIIAEGVRDRAGPCATPEAARAALRAAGIEVAAEALGEPAPRGKPSTLVRFPLAGGYKVLTEGALPAAEVHRRLHIHILYVCTGNTCRSPMAEAITAHLAERLEPGSIPVDAASAGMAAYDGEPITPEAVTALAKRGIQPQTRRSRAVTAEMLEQADLVFGLTHTHIGTLKARHPGAAGKVHLLDPQGQDVPDPIGGPQRLYDETARRLSDLIAARMKEVQS